MRPNLWRPVGWSSPTEPVAFAEALEDAGTLFGAEGVWVSSSLLSASMSSRLTLRFSLRMCFLSSEVSEFRYCESSWGWFHVDRGGFEFVSTKNWWCVLASYCLTHPGGSGRCSSSMLRLDDGGMPFLAWCAARDASPATSS